MNGENDHVSVCSLGGRRLDYHASCSGCVLARSRLLTLLTVERSSQDDRCSACRAQVILGNIWALRVSLRSHSRHRGLHTKGLRRRLSSDWICVSGKGTIDF